MRELNTIEYLNSNLVSSVFYEVQSYIALNPI